MTNDQAPPHIYLQSERNNSTVTPNLDNFSSSSIGGGISGLALGVANSNNRQSGIDAMEHDGYTGPAERAYNTTGAENPYVPPPVYESSQYGSNMALDAAAAAPGRLTPGLSSSHLSDTSQNHSPYNGVSDGPYQRQSHYNSETMDIINPDEIVDDGEDEFTPGGKSVQAGAAVAGGAAAGGFFSKLFGKSNQANPSYGLVPGAGLERGGMSEKAKTGMAGRKKRALIVGGVLGFIILGAIVGGAVGGTIGNKHNNKDGDTSSSSSGSSSDDDDTDLGKDSSEIKALMNNDALHKVFPGIDYTPWGVQYPLCLKYPPSQNNVTRDIAVLSQLTNTVRLYGTDCNQTEMTLHAIDRLGLTDMKLWLGVWIDTNTTTTDRQLKQLYDIIDKTNDTSIYKGVIVGNEALYRAGSTKSSAETNLINYINGVRTQLKKRNLSDLLVATSDLGDNWNAKLTDAVDVVMSNVHPFFAGVSVDVAAGWTWDFWQSHDVNLTEGTNKKQVISEVGWPSDGGKDCGGSSVCDSSTPGSVASIENQNKFMADWICQALENGTDYFWFEAFDEPWKVEFNTEDEAWEDKWGLMDPGRVLKKGLTIPDCGGKTAT
ncbi:Glycoside hydrolase superfamily [Penicillium taxi]|uniref:Glycoside hydrolase superfamily n=1 Tax=Penicillium taxi TaxID=168475 RepID=UPI002545A976|nr:Glycoside hydrolase superfamily [Penicillium taxi]KAJ5908168.1 Glycoside hydrolase superfamily [Penicillium taxi]